MRARTWVRIGAVALLLLMAAPVAFADFYDGFDGYTAGTTSPAPWTMTPDSSGCWVPATSVAGVPNALSAPNVFYVWYTRTGNGCSGTTHSFYMTLPVNATSAVLTLSGYFGYLSSSGGMGAVDQVQLLFCQGSALPPRGGCAGTTLFSLTSLSGSGCTTNCWTKFTSTATATAGQQYTAVLWIYTASGVNSFSFYVDNVNVKGGSVIVSGANLFLTDYNSKAWFNITNYAGSRVYAYYPNSIQAVYNNINTPDLNVNLLGSNLITAWVGNAYARSIIPNQGGKNTVYLDSPTVVLAYSFSVQDFSNTYLPGSQIYVALDNLVVTSGYLDGQDQFTAWLQPGNYTITLKSGANTYVTYSSVSSATVNPIPVQIATIKHSLPVTKANFNFEAGWDQNYQNVVVFYHDPNVDTTFIDVTIYNQTAVGATVMQDSTYSPGPWGNFTAIISCPACKAANSQQIYVKLTVTDQYGTKQVFGTQALAGGPLFANTPNVPDYGGLFAFLPSGAFNPWLELIGLAILIGEAGLTGYYEAPAGFILITITLTGEGLASMIPLPPTIGGSLTLFAVTAYMTRQRDVPSG